MSTDDESPEQRDILTEAALALSAISYTAAKRDLTVQVDVLSDLLELLQSARCMEATGPYGLVCTLCHANVVGDDGDTEPNLLKQIYLIQQHTCAPSRPLTEVDRARAALDTATGALTDECRNATPVWTVVDATLRLVHEVVKAERDRVAKAHGNIDPDMHADWDALDRVVELTEPERIRRG